MLDSSNNALKNDLNDLSNLSPEVEIDPNELADDTRTIDELCNHYKAELLEKEILCTVSNPGIGIFAEGNFEDNVWAIHRDIKKAYRYIKFDKLNRFEQKNVSNNQLLLMKCWVSQGLLDNFFEFEEVDNASTKGRSSEHLSQSLNILTDFITDSNNFSSEFLDETKGDNVDYFFSSRTHDLTSSAQKFYVRSIYSYLNFCLSKSKIKEVIFPEETYRKYFKRISNLLENISETSKPVADDDNNTCLPSSKDILLFDYYVNRFFDDEKIHESYKMYFYPLLIWWKLTNIIPMRPSELCTKIQRDCIFPEGDKYYLKIGRSKKRNTKGTLPTLTNYQITKEFYDLINNYIEKTNEYGLSNTLLSYKAFVHFRKEITKYNTIYFGSGTTGEKSKLDDTYFSIDQLDLLITHFYNKVISGYFKDSMIEDKITASDTRHFAFTSLMLQGLPLVEIAILGGHSTTNTLDEYTYDNNMYIDSQVFKTLNRSLGHYKVGEDRVSDLVFSKPKVCPVPIEECVETSFSGIKLGCCTAQVDDACESYDCYNCSKWYCEPTHQSFKALMRIYQLDLDARNEDLKSNIDFMLKLFKNVELLDSENPDSEVCITGDLTNKLNQLSHKIQDDTEEIIKIKSKLLEGINVDKDSELDIISKLQILNNTFKKDTNYLE